MSRREDFELFGAARVVSEHASGGQCGQCEPDGACRLYRWADVLLRAWEAEHGQRYPHYAPSWQAVQAPCRRS